MKRQTKEIEETVQELGQKLYALRGILLSLLKVTLLPVTVS